MSTQKKALLGIIVVGLVMVLIDTFHLPGHTRFWRSLNNAGHAPLFGILSIALLHLIRHLWRGCTRQPLVCYIVTFVLAAGLGVLSELVQYFGPRDADITDLFRDITGAATFLALYSTFDPQAQAIRRDRHRVVRSFVSFGAAFALFLAVSPPVFWGVAFLQRNQCVPVLCEFDSFWSTRFVRTQSAQFRRGATETAGDSENGPFTGGELTFRAGQYPGLSVVDVYPDWREYDSLVITAYAGDAAPAFLALRIDDRAHNNRRTDRFTTQLPLRPGRNRLAVSLDDVRHAPETREMDLSRMTTIHVFGDSTFAGARVVLQEIRLK
jgi:hypothetical protein